MLVTAQIPWLPDNDQRGDRHFTLDGAAVAGGVFGTPGRGELVAAFGTHRSRGRSLQGECTESAARREHLEGESVWWQAEQKLPVAPDKASHKETGSLSARRSNPHAPVVSLLESPGTAPVRTGHGLRASADAMAPPPKPHPFTPCPRTPAPCRRLRVVALSPGNRPDRTVERAWRAGAGWSMSRSTECRSRSTTGPGPAGGAASAAAV